MVIKNRFTGIMQESALQAAVASTNPYSAIGATKLNMIKRDISKILDEINNILPLMPTSFHSVKVHLETHYVQVTSALANMPQTNYDVITDSMNWERDVLGYNPNIVYHLTTYSAIATSISHAADNGYHYITTYNFLDSDIKCIAVYRLNNLRNSPLARNEKIYGDFIEWAKTMGVVYVEGIPF